MPMSFERSSVSKKTGEERIVSEYIWTVRSDMLNGIPLRRKAELAA